MVKWLVVMLLLTGCRKSLYAMLTSPEKQLKKEQTASGSNEIELAAGLYERAFGATFNRKLIELPTSSQATVVPKSGYWYPQSTGGTNVFGALTKYDRAFNGGQNKAAQWEATYHAQNVQWAGHCNGFSANAIRHQEPRLNVTRGGIVFTPYDIKALLAEIYMSAGYAFTGGSRCEARPGSPAFRNPATLDRMDACEDINPGVWHLAVANWIGTRKQAIIFDNNADNQVWNFPLYSYSYTTQEISAQDALSLIRVGGTSWPFNAAASKFYLVQMQIKYSKEGTTETLNQVVDSGPTMFQYVLEVDASGNVIGGEWHQQNQATHPDFIWIPLETKPGNGTSDEGNPYIDPDEVLQMWAESRGLTSPDAEPPPYDIDDFDTKWGNYDKFRVSISGVQYGVAARGARNVVKIEPIQSLIQSTSDKLDVLVNGKFYLSPTLSPGNIVEFPINLDPGFSKVTLNWKTSQYREFSEDVEVYTME